MDIIKPCIEDEDFFKWFGGFFDGEGSFTVCLTQHKNTHNLSNMSFHPTVQLSQVVDNKDCIYESRDIIIKYLPTHIILIYLDRKYGRNREQLKININGIDNCLAISRLLLPYLKAKKQTCINFIEICTMLKNQVHLTYDGFLAIARLRDTLNNRAKPKDYWSYDRLKDNLIFRERIENKRGKRVTNAEKEKIKEMYYDNKTCKEISEVIGRTGSSIDHILSRMKIRGKVNDSQKTNYS